VAVISRHDAAQGYGMEKIDELEGSSIECVRRFKVQLET
jgi:hypothetical protein